MNKEQLLNELTLTYLKKNKDYGNSADETYQLFGENAYLIRIHDKLKRIERLLVSEAEVNESIKDTILDLIVYTAMWKSVECEPRIVGLAKEIHDFLNSPMYVLGYILDCMPDGFVINQGTIEYIEQFIYKQI